MPFIKFYTVRARIKMFFKKIKYWIIAVFRTGVETLFPPKEIPYSEIPIIINNFNRLEYLKKLLNGLEKRGYKNVYILDNQSTYLPLLNFYKTCKHEVIFLKENYGYKALWLSGNYRRFAKNYFVYTDSDLEIIDDCPADFLGHFRNILKENRLCYKVGFSLKLDDIPDHYTLKDQVLDWEKQYYSHPVGENLFRAPIDTTFALYRPRSNSLVRSRSALIYRTAHPYQVRHLPWYVDGENLSEEEKYYMRSSKENSWVYKMEHSMKIREK